MRISPILTLALVPAALIAQVSAVPDYTGILKAKAPGIEALLSDGRPLAALEQSEALLPPALPLFDTSNPNASRKSSFNFSSLTTLYLLAAKCANDAGEWERALDFCAKADACAKANYQKTLDAYTPLIASWTQAIDQARKTVADDGDHIAVLTAKEAGRNPAEEAEYKTLVAKKNTYDTSKDSAVKREAAEYLQKNKDRIPVLEGKVLNQKEYNELQAYKVAQGNLQNGPQVIASMQKDIDATKAETALAQPRIDTINRNLKEETESLQKGLATIKLKGKPVKETSGPAYEEAKTRIYEALLTSKANFDAHPKKSDRLNLLFRLRHNLAGNPAGVQKVEEVIERVRNDQDPIPAKKPGQAKKAK